MRMLFRTFSGYAKYGELPPTKYVNNEMRIMKADEVGLEIIHSATEQYNARCSGFGDSYIARCLSREPDWKQTMLDAIEFMDGYNDIGCATYYHEKSKETEILVDCANDFSAYEDYECPFFIIFNARPSLSLSSDKNLIVGRDVYSISYQQHSAIVWNLNRFKEFPLRDYTFWGIQHEDGSRLSNTGDVMYGLKNGKLADLFR